MYEELVQQLRTCIDENIPCAIADCGYEPFGNEDCIDQLMRKAADAIEELQEDNAALNGTVSNLIGQIAELSKPRWIPVTERLPSPMKAVLVWTPYKHNIFMAYLLGNKWYVWGPDDSCCHNWPEYHAITHWMPLPPAPEPPKEEHDG